MVPIEPYQVANYSTNAGAFNAFNNGTYEQDAEKAYHYYLSLKKEGVGYHGNLRPVVNRILHQSIVCHKLYNAYLNIRNLKYHPYGTAYLQYLHEIQNVCNQFDCNFRLFIISDNGKSINPELFQELIPYIPQNLTEADYTPDRQFNTQGYQIFFEFIRNNLQENAHSEQAWE